MELVLVYNMNPYFPLTIWAQQYALYMAKWGKVIDCGNGQDESKGVNNRHQTGREVSWRMWGGSHVRGREKKSISGGGAKKSQGPREKNNLLYSKNWLESQCACSSVVKKETEVMSEKWAGAGPWMSSRTNQRGWDLILNAWGSHWGLSRIGVTGSEGFL